MTENERVKAVRKSLSLTLERFGAQIGVGKSAISDLERGRCALSNQMCVSICREFGVNETWLRAGVGEMFVQRGRDGEIESFMERLLREEQESFRRRVITALSRLSVSEWDTFAHFLEEMESIRQGETPAPQSSTTHELTREELHAELDRQLDEQERAVDGLPPARGGVNKKTPRLWRGA